MQSISMVREGELRTLDPLLFSHVAFANVPRLYLFYVSSFGHYLLRNSKTPRQSYALVEARKVLIKILLQCDLDRDFEFLMNSVALLLTISVDVSELANSQILSIIKSIIKKLSVSKDPSSSIILLGVFSAMSESLQATIFPLFSTRDMRIQRTVAFTVREFVREKRLSALDSETSTIKRSLFFALHACYMLLAENLSDPTQFDPEAEVSSFKPLYLFLDDFAQSLESVMSQTFVRAERGELFVKLRGEPRQHRFDSPLFFRFFFRLSQMPQFDFHPSAMAAF